MSNIYLYNHYRAHLITALGTTVRTIIVAASDEDHAQIEAERQFWRELNRGGNRIRIERYFPNLAA